MYKNRLSKLITCIGLSAVMMMQTVFAEVSIDTEPPVNESDIITDTASIDEAIFAADGMWADGAMQTLALEPQSLSESVVQTWSFGDAAGWTADSAVAVYADGAVKLTGTGTFVSPDVSYEIGSAVGKVRYIRARIKNTTVSDTLSVSFNDNAGSVSFNCPQSTGFIDILIDMSNSASWTGTLTNFSFNTVDGSIYLDEVALVKEIEKLPKEVYRQTFDDPSVASAIYTNNSATANVTDDEVQLAVSAGGIWGIKPLDANGNIIWKNGLKYDIHFQMRKNDNGGGVRQIVAGYGVGTAFTNPWGGNGWCTSAESTTYVQMMRTLSYTSSMGAAYFGFKQPSSSVQLAFDNIIINEYPAANVSTIAGVASGIIPNDPIAIVMDTPLGTTVPTVEFVDGGSATVESRVVGTGGANNTVFVAASNLTGCTEYTVEVSGLKTSDNKDIPEFTVTFTTLPENVEFTDGITEITEDGGTATLTAKVNPAGLAPQDIVWSVDDESIATISATGVLSAVNNGTVTVTAKSKDYPVLYAEKEIVISGQLPPMDVIYDGNAGDDAVTGLPVTVQAKGNYVLSTDYPQRPYYTFAGWMATPDGTDVITSVNVGASDVTVYAKWEYADKWLFNLDGYLAGFTVENGSDTVVSDGKLITTQSSANAPKFVSDELNIDASQYESLIIKLKNDNLDENTSLDMTIHTESGDRTYGKAIISNNSVEYVFDIRGISNTITGFEFTASNKNGATIEIDEIRFRKNSVAGYDANTNDVVTNMPSNIYDEADLPQTVSDMIPVRGGYEFCGWSLSADGSEIVRNDYQLQAGDRLYAVWKKLEGISWTFDSDLEGWTANNVSAQQQNGAMVADAQSTSPQFVSPSIGMPVSADGINRIKLRLKHSTNGTKIKLTAKTTANASIIETIDLPKTYDYRDIYLDMSEIDGWSGRLMELVLDAPIDMSSVGGKIEIDEVSLFNETLDETLLIDYDFETAEQETRVYPWNDDRVKWVSDPINSENNAIYINSSDDASTSIASIYTLTGENMDGGNLYRWSYKAMAAPDTDTIPTLTPGIYNTASGAHIPLTGDTTPGGLEKDVWKTYTVMVCQDIPLWAEGKNPRLGWSHSPKSAQYLIDDYIVTRFEDFDISDYSQVHDGAELINTEDGLNLSFNMGLDTPVAENFTLTDEFGSTVAVTGVSAYHGNLVIEHEPLLSLTEYTLNIGLVKDKYGRKIENREIKFTTDADFDVTGLDLVDNATTATVKCDIVNNSLTEKTVIVKCWEYVGSTTVVHQRTVTVASGVDSIEETFEGLNPSATLTAAIWRDNENIRPISTSVTQ